MNKNDYILSAKKAIADAGLHLATYEDIDSLSNISVNAYKDYPLHNWFSNGKYDPYLSKKLMLISLKTMIKNGIIYSDAKNATGFAIWLPPNFKGYNAFSFMIHGGISLVFHCGLRIILKLLSYENFAMTQKKKYTGNKDWYLYNLSVKKEAQGKGIATKLLTPMIDFCNKTSYPCYLETNNEKNVHIYQHFGFKLKETSFIPNSTVKHFSLIKEH